MFEDKELEAVLIATRHDLHGKLALEALQAGKHVLVEKPLCLTQAELDSFKQFYGTGGGKGKPVLLTGFNRRFSKYAREIKRWTDHRTNPMIINYRMNAGYIPLNHWVHTEEGGGRNIGEACHLYDLFTYLTGAKVKDVAVQTIRPKTGHYSHKDNFTALLSFEDGSTASLTYTSLGDKEYPKERMEVFFDGKVIFLDDYKELKASGIKVKTMETATPDKGQLEELEAFGRVIREGGEWPIPWWQQVQNTEISFRVESFLSAQSQT
jgi:predicted dehydrogenase